MYFWMSMPISTLCCDLYHNSCALYCAVCQSVRRITQMHSVRQHCDLSGLVSLFSSASQHSWCMEDRDSFVFSSWGFSPVHLTSEGNTMRPPLQTWRPLFPIVKGRNITLGLIPAPRRVPFVFNYDNLPSRLHETSCLCAISHCRGSREERFRVFAPGKVIISHTGHNDKNTHWWAGCVVYFFHSYLGWSVQVVLFTGTFIWVLTSIFTLANLPVC